ncbi:hypothetical protein M2139_001325 [Enterococcus sp. PF1-24]|uniref:hypothetical protein n=1 Tax=unclassified Enterococcus TaxID=2608891 RepID=UPI0024747472|nr:MULTISPECIES: hypothetical protein [unclassified Enterococcus]MDH6364370.1 hypothetical protein [Enterococcus sp. PFB1-1]MDH6401441.1 hypothetical protein [Enterococcus sp. PF1-24]
MNKEKIIKWLESNKNILTIVGVVILISGAFIVGRFSSRDKQTEQNISSDLAMDFSTTNSSNVDTSTSTSIENIELTKTVKFDVDGKYEEGKHINAGVYYIVLTKLEYASDDKYKHGSIFVNGCGHTEEVRSGHAIKVDVKKGSDLEFSGHYYPNWEVTLFTEDDYAKYKETVSDSSSEIKKESVTEPSQETKPAEKNDGELYSDQYIKVTKSGGIITFKNLTENELTIDGNANLNDSIVVNMYSFGYIGELVPNGVLTENISQIRIEDIGEPGDVEDGETLGGNKLFKHQMKSGDKLTWAGEIKDADYNTLAQFTMDIHY